MDNDTEFPHLEAAARRWGDRNDELSRAQLRELLCHDCEFWHDDHEEELECSCFRMLRIMLRRGELTPARLADAVRLARGVNP